MDGTRSTIMFPCIEQDTDGWNLQNNHWVGSVVAYNMIHQDDN